MVSFISTLPIFIFFLFNGYFALPIVDDQLSTSTYLPENNLLTTAQTFNLRLVADDESSTSSDIHPKRSTEFEMSTSIGGLVEETSSDGMSMTTEQTHSDKREDDDLSYTTVESTTEFAQLNRRGFVNEFENQTQQMKIELTTNDMSSFTSSSIPTSTKKYLGLLKDNNEYDEEEEDQSTTKSTKISRKSSGKKSKVYSEDEDSNVPTAVFDQKALDRVPNIPNDFLMLDESNDFVVTSISNRIFPSTTHENSQEKEEETQPLNQGKNSAHTKKKESDH